MLPKYGDYCYYREDKIPETRQADKDFMVQTKGLKLLVHRPEIYFVWTDTLFRVCLFNLSQNFKVG